MRNSGRSVLLLTLSVFLSAMVVAAHGQDNVIPSPSAAVLLQISGNIAHSNSQDSASSASVAFDLSMLEELGAEKIITNTPWTEGDTQFEGVLVRRLLRYVGARSNHLVLTGLDGYQVEITDVDFERYPIIIAYKRDSRYMDVRRLGPLWLMFPFDQFPELNNDTNKSAAVWQLVKLVVR